MTQRIRHSIGPLLFTLIACACEGRHPAVPLQPLWTPVGARIMHGPRTYADGAMDVSFETPVVPGEEISAALIGYYGPPWRQRALVNGWTWRVGPPGQPPPASGTALSY